MANKNTIQSSFIEDGIRYMQCSNCGSYVSNISNLTTSVLCSRCFSIRHNKMFPEKEEKKNKKPLGWHWMKEFVDKDGNVYHKGKEVPELKGTLSPTKVKKIKRKKKKKKEKISYEKRINILAKEYKEKRKLKRKNKIDSNK